MCLTPTPPEVGSFMGKNVKCLGHFMNCRENRYVLFAHPRPPHPRGEGFRGEHLIVNKHGNAVILRDYTANILGEAG